MVTKVFMVLLLSFSQWVKLQINSGDPKKGLIYQFEVSLLVRYYFKRGLSVLVILKNDKNCAFDQGDR